MQMSNNPDWSALAVQAVMRLRAHYALPEDLPDAEAWESDLAMPPDWGAAPAVGKPRKMSERGLASPIAALAASPQAMQIPLEAQRTVSADGGDPIAIDAQGRTTLQVVLPPARLLLALRLCASIRSAERVTDMLVPGAVTVFELGDIDAMELREVMKLAIMPQNLSMARHWPLLVQDGLQYLCLVVFSSSEDAPKRQQMLEQLTSALEQPHPVLILTPSLADLPADILRILPAPLRLAPLSRDILMAQLRASHSATGKLDTRLRETLPNDRDLARISPPVLMAALRAPCARQVAERLRALIMPVPADGPDMKDIEGYGAAEVAARQMVADLQGWSEGRIAWGDVQRSVLFYGVPGTGKSHLARAMGQSAGVTLVRGSFAAWQAQGHLGHMLKAMRACFAEAAQKRPAILVIDEIDAVGDRADPDRHGASYRQQVINGFLEEMDRLKVLEGVLVVGTCNFPDRIDAAVLRPGRFDLKVEVPLPGAQALARMLQDGMPEGLSKSDLDRLTRAAAGQSAADVDGALRQARSAARAEDLGVTTRDVLKALSPAAQGENPARDHRIALHECGHAIVGTVLGVGQVTRLTLSAQGGQAWLRLNPGEGLLGECEAEMAYHLAGRAAERLILGTVTAGSGGSAESDLAQATTLAVQIDTKFGLGAEGLAWQDIPTAAYLRIPENAARIRTRLNAAEARAMAILDEQRDVLLAMAAALEEHRMLEADDLKRWMGRSWEKSGARGGNVGCGRVIRSYFDLGRFATPKEDTATKRRVEHLSRMSEGRC